MEIKSTVDEGRVFTDEYGGHFILCWVRSSAAPFRAYIQVAPTGNILDVLSESEIDEQRITLRPVG